MKKVSSCILVATIVIGVAGPASVFAAQNELKLKVRAEVNAEAQASTSNLKLKNQTEPAKGNNASSTASIKEKIELKLEKRLEKMVERYQATLDRENSILRRVESRIEKVKNTGGNIETASKLALEAKTEIGLATSSLATFKTTIVSIDNATTSATSTPGQITKENMKKLKKLSAEVEKHIRLAHKAMVNAVVSLKGASGLNATSSAEVKTQK